MIKLCTKLLQLYRILIYLLVIVFEFPLQYKLVILRMYYYNKNYPV